MCSSDLKHLADGEWRSFFAKHKPGTAVEVTVRKVNEAGLAVELTRSIEGFIRIGDVDEEKISAQELEQRFKPGDKIEALISRVEVERKKAYLSLRALAKAREREELQKYMKSEDDSVTTFGDLLQNELDKNK